MVPPHCGSVWQRPQKRNNGCCLQFCPGRSCPLALTLTPGTSILPICPWCCSRCCPSAAAQREGVRVSPCVRSSKMICLENPAVSSTDPTPAGFQSPKLWGLIFLALEPWTGWSGVELGSLAPKMSLHFMSSTCGFGTSLFCISAFPPLYSACLSGIMWFL